MHNNASRIILCNIRVYIKWNVWFVPFICKQFSLSWNSSWWWVGLRIYIKLSSNRECNYLILRYFKLVCIEWAHFNLLSHLIGYNISFSPHSIKNNTFVRKFNRFISLCYLFIAFIFSFLSNLCERETIKRWWPLNILLVIKTHSYQNI